MSYKYSCPKHTCTYTHSLSPLQTLTSHLDYDDENLLTVLISLSQIAKLQPEVFAMKHKQIIRDFVVKQLLVVDRVR